MVDQIDKNLLLNKNLKDEADRILYKYGLFDTLNKYGRLHITGSYFYDTMAWRDLDLYLEVDKFDLSQSLELSKEIGVILKPHAMNYRNELIYKRPGFPDGIYWGVYTYLDFHEMWKIDLWIFNSEQVKTFNSNAHNLHRRINAEHRKYLIEIKAVVSQHPDYFRKFKSLDVYDAVLDYNIKTVEGFRDWLEKEKGISLTFD